MRSEPRRERGSEPIAHRFACAARRFLHTLLAAGAAFGWALSPLHAQRDRGELRLEVADAAGGAVTASCRLTSLSSLTELSFQTVGGAYRARPLPFGRYSLTCSHPGLEARPASLEIRSEIPVTVKLVLRPAGVETTLTVADRETLLDPSQTNAAQYVSGELLRNRRSTAPGRSLLELVNTQPGWLLEANGILHPRGSEYDVQYVIDGLPLFDNRSPAFAQTLGVDEFQSMRVLTGGYPAEYGRKLGGVVEITSERDPRKGWHGKAALQTASFASRNGYLSARGSAGANRFGLSGEALITDRYLDAPVEENFTNHASGGGFAGHFERDWTADSRTRFYSHYRRTGFQAPNELLQQAAGQRQDRGAGEAAGMVAHQIVLGPNALGAMRGMVRDMWANLWSNALSTPIQPFQDRGFREAYIQGSLSVHHGRHEIKTGAEAIYGRIQESFRYRIAAYELGGVPIFDDDVPEEFDFRARGRNSEQAAYVQDIIRLGRLTLSAGLRWDRYSLHLTRNGVSPRVAAAFSLPGAGLVVRGSYDRVFQTPAVENILLATSDLVGPLGDEGVFFPLEPSKGHFYEAGFSKSVLSRLRIDGTWFRREFRNYADDSVLFNTGVSFPITFSRAEIQGYEAKIEAPSWGRVSGFASWGNLHGVGHLPVAGGLFLGDEAEEALEGTGSFPITQDQRNTFRARVRVELHSRLWAALGGRYNSGLPVELEGVTDEGLLESQYGAAILEKVNFGRERVRPSAALDVSAGATLWTREGRALRLQADILNIAGRLNVINFSGLFSGTAIEPRRSAALRLEAEF